MIYVQYFHASAIDPMKLVEACGDRAVVILDGRHSLADNMAIARDEGKRRGYLAFTLHHGETFTRSKSITSIQRI